MAAAPTAEHAASSRAERNPIDDLGEVDTVTADAAQLRQIVMNLVTNGAEALDGQCGVVTGMGGPAAARAIWELDPTARILVMSGFTQQALGDTELRAQCAGFLQKPFTLAALRAALKETLEPKIGTQRTTGTRWSVSSRHLRWSPRAKACREAKGNPSRLRLAWAAVRANSRGAS